MASHLVESYINMCMYNVVVNLPQMLIVETQCLGDGLKDAAGHAAQLELLRMPDRRKAPEFYAASLEFRNQLSARIFQRLRARPSPVFRAGDGDGDDLFQVAPLDPAPDRYATEVTDFRGIC